MSADDDRRAAAEAAIRTVEEAKTQRQYGDRANVGSVSALKASLAALEARHAGLVELLVANRVVTRADVAKYAADAMEQKVVAIQPVGDPVKIP